MSMDNTIRISANQSSSIGNNLEFFVETGSLEPPIVCLADNNGFPYVRDIYARQESYSNKKGVHVSVRFESQAKGNELAINLTQSDMKGDYTVIPLG